MAKKRNTVVLTGFNTRGKAAEKVEDVVVYISPGTPTKRVRFAHKRGLIYTRKGTYRITEQPLDNVYYSVANGVRIEITTNGLTAQMNYWM